MSYELVKWKSCKIEFWKSIEDWAFTKKYSSEEWLEKSMWSDNAGNHCYQSYFEWKQPLASMAILNFEACIQQLKTSGNATVDVNLVSVQRKHIIWYQLFNINRYQYYFFYLLFDRPGSTLSDYLRDSLTHLMLITVFLSIFNPNLNEKLGQHNLLCSLADTNKKVLF